MIGFLRFVGILNAAIWFGGAVFFTFGIGRASFSPEMKFLLGANNYPYFSGAIAQLLISRYFDLQAICSVIACLHLLGESIYMGKLPGKFRAGLVIGLCAAALLGGFWLQPKMNALHAVKYSTSAKPDAREAAGRSFKIWHGFSMAINLVVVCSIGVYFWRTANPSASGRFVGPLKFH